jgi:hypothetical protein
MSVGGIAPEHHPVATKGTTMSPNRTNRAVVQARVVWAHRSLGRGLAVSASTAGSGSSASTVRRSRSRSSKTWSALRSTVDAAPAIPHWALETRLSWLSTGLSTISGNTTPAASTN